MILVANFLNAVGRILHFVLMLYIWVIFIRVIFSWINVPSLYQIQLIFYRLTEPVLSRVRKYVPPYRFGGLDISPIIVFLLILFIDTFLVKSLIIYAQRILMQQTFSF